MNVAMLTMNVVLDAAKKISALKRWNAFRSARPIMIAKKILYFIIAILIQLIVTNLAAHKVDVFSIVLYAKKDPKLLVIIAIKIRNANRKIVKEIDVNSLNKKIIYLILLTQALNF
jgi:hypothetical protein